MNDKITNMSVKLSKRNLPQLYDPHILNRVQKCLENTQKTAGFGSIVKQLESKYPEYRRRKQGPFRQLVKQALRIINQDSIDSNAAEESLESEDEAPINNAPKKTNIMNSFLNTMYNKPPVPQRQKKKKPPGDTISISSDESQDISAEFHPTVNSTTAGPNKTNLDSNARRTPIEEVPSLESQSNAGKKRSEKNVSEEESAPKKKMTYREPIIDDHRSQNGDEENENAIESANRPPRNQSKSKEKPLTNFKQSIKLENSVLKFRNLAGIDKLLTNLCQILVHFKTPDIYNTLGVEPPRGILIYGPTGSGKTCLAYAIAGQLGIPIINVPATELIAGITGESEQRIRDIFEQAADVAPCVLFIDDIEAISSNRQNAQRDMERRVVSQLLSSIDNLNKPEHRTNILIIGATTRPDTLDSALRRAGRFDYEIGIPIPNRKERRQILNLMCNGLKIESPFDYDMIAELTPGYMGADLSALVARATLFAVKRKFLEEYLIFDETTEVVEDSCSTNEVNVELANTANESCSISPILPRSPDVIAIDDDDDDDDDDDTTENGDITDVNTIKAEKGSTVVDSISLCQNRWQDLTLPQMIDYLNQPMDEMCLDGFCVTFQDFKEAIKVLQPSAKREGFITVPDVSWNDIGSLFEIREELRLAILAPVKYTKEMERLGLTSPSGVLLCGPPGCGKTLIAKAIANEAGINFLSVKGPELMNMYVGESERAVRDCFARARNSAPCVIFFDEFDSLCPKRSDAGSESNSGVRVVNQLLTEMDGIEERKGVFLMAASNRPDIIDPAILRPGRLDTILYVGLPTKDDRIDILRALTKNRSSPVLSQDVDFSVLADKTDGFTGADISGMIKKAAMISLRDAIQNQRNMGNVHVAMKNFIEAIESIRPSVSEQDRKLYEKMREKYAAPRVCQEVVIV